MKTTPDDRTFAAALRREAEALLNGRKRVGDSPPAELESARLVHELQVQQVELELQNAELRKAQTELEAALERHNEFYDFAPVGYFTLKPDATIQQANLTTSNLLGVPRSRLLNQPLAELVTGADRRVFDTWFMRAFTGDAPETCELQLLPVGRPPLTVQLRACLSADGQECRVVMTDITQRKQTEAALRENNGLFSLFMQHSPIYAFIKTVTATESRVLYASDSFQQMIGRSGAELVGKSMAELFPPDMAAKITADDWAVVNGGQVLKVEENFQGRDYSSVKFPIFLGGKTLLAGYTIDTTDRNQTEAALRASEAMLKRTEAIAHVGSWEWDVATDTVQWSDELFRIFQRNLTEGAPSFAEHPALYHPDDLERLQRAVEAALNEGSPYELELRAFRKDGATRVGLARGYAEKKPGQCAVRLFGSFEDITERKQLEERVRQSQKMGAVSHLAGGIAHEFNNILAAIMLSLETVKQLTVKGEAHEWLEQMEKLSQRAAGLVRQMLAFSRQSVLTCERVDVAVLVAEHSKMLARLLGERIRVELIPADQPTWVVADLASLEQVMMNLAGNARDAMKAGGVLRLGLTAVEVSAETAAAHSGVQPGEFVCLSVTDTGCGMTPEIQRRLFEPFFTTKDVGQGPGLGLPTVLGIVEQHHGWVEVESQWGQGSTFRVYLPSVAAPQPAPPVAPPLGSVRGEGTILIVEDEPALLNVGARVLTYYGYQVLTAADGAAALAVWAEHREKIDLLFTDMVMPGQWNGEQLAERLRADKPGLRVIITSGYNTQFMKSGEDPETAIIYLPKPCRTEILMPLIQTCLRRA